MRWSRQAIEDSSERLIASRRENPFRPVKGNLRFPLTYTYHGCHRIRPDWQLLAVPILAVSRVLFGIGLFRRCQHRFDLLLQARLGLVHALVAHRLVLAGVRL